jgi:hypothetical protein
VMPASTASLSRRRFHGGASILARERDGIDLHLLRPGNRSRLLLRPSVRALAIALQTLVQDADTGSYECIHACMHACVCMYVSYACIHGGMHVWVHACIHGGMHVWVHACIHGGMYVWVYVCVCVCIVCM